MARYPRPLQADVARRELGGYQPYRQYARASIHLWQPRPDGHGRRAGTDFPLHSPAPVDAFFEGTFFFGTFDADKSRANHKNLLSAPRYSHLIGSERCRRFRHLFSRHDRDDDLLQSRAHLGNVDNSPAHRADPHRRARRWAVAFCAQRPLPRCRIYPPRDDAALAFPLAGGIFIRIYP